MSIIDLLNKVGLEKVNVQPLNESIINCTLSKKDSEVTFCTSPGFLAPGDLIGRPRKIGLIIWMDYEDAQKARSEP